MNEAKNTPTAKPLEAFTAEEIKAAVAERYGRVAAAPGAKFNFPVGRRFAQSVGYEAARLDHLPAGLGESFTGAGNPQPYVDAHPGQTVLDLGCGAGLDLCLYAQKVGPTGKLYGLDLSPDKDAVMREVARVLKPGGRTIFAEIVLKSELPCEVRRELDDWFRCIGGALVQDDFLRRLERNGLSRPQVLWLGRNARTGHELALSAVIRAEKSP